MQKGDKIIRIDGNDVSTGDEIYDALITNDYPGAVLRLTVMRTSPIDADKQECLEVALTKMDASLIADRCQVFSAFAALKVRLPFSSVCHFN